MDVEKLADELVQLNISQLNQLEKILKDKYGIEFSGGIAVGAGGVAPSETSVSQESPAKKNVDVVIVGLSPTASKLKIIQTVKKILNVDLKKAKELVDNLPSTIKSGVPQEEAEGILKELSEAGCSVELK